MIFFTDQLQELDRILSIDGGEIIEEFRESVAVIEVIEDGLRRDAGAPEDDGASHDLGIGMDRAVIQGEHESRITPNRH